jgi:hypothetical protein
MLVTKLCWHVFRVASFFTPFEAENRTQAVEGLHNMAAAVDGHRDSLLEEEDQVLICRK